jgi:hypothetical protein
VSMVGGQTVEEVHQLLWIPTTNVYGPPWDTLAILLLWLWVGMMALGQSVRPAEE